MTGGHDSAFATMPSVIADILSRGGKISLDDGRDPRKVKYMFSTRYGAGSLLNVIVQNTGLPSHLRQLVAFILPKQAGRGAVLLTEGFESTWVCRRNVCLWTSVSVRVVAVNGTLLVAGRGLI